MYYRYWVAGVVDFKYTQQGGMRMQTATLRYDRAYFSKVCQAHIPAGWTVVPDDGSGELDCDDEQDARAVAKRFGYTITRVEK